MTKWILLVNLLQFAKSITSTSFTHVSVAWMVRRYDLNDCRSNIYWSMWWLTRLDMSSVLTFKCNFPCITISPWVVKVPFPGLAQSIKSLTITQRTTKCITLLIKWWNDDKYVKWRYGNAITEDIRIIGQQQQKHYPNPEWDWDSPNALKYTAQSPNEFSAMGTFGWIPFCLWRNCSLNLPF